MALLSEHRGTFSAVKVYREAKGSLGLVEVEEETKEGERGALGSKKLRWWQATQLTFRQVFLPHGFPSSVSQDYTAYQIWDTVQVNTLTCYFY